MNRVGISSKNNFMHTKISASEKNQLLQDRINHKKETRLEITYCFVVFNLFLIRLMYINNFVIHD